MASGILGKVNPTANTNTTVYTVPVGKLTTANVSLCNRGDSTIKVRLAIAATGTPALTEYLEYDCTLPPKGVLERSALVLEAGQNIVVYTDTATVSVVAFGMEE
jgi:hypothetical protein